MICPNCNADKWKNVDEFRIKTQRSVWKKNGATIPPPKTNAERKDAVETLVPMGMSMCEDCGFISYPDQWLSKEEILKHYRNDYRQPPTHFNVYAGERKNHFHHSFLQPLFKKWQNEKLDSPQILEVGAAFGFSLYFFRQLFPTAQLDGTEITTSMRRVAKRELGLDLTEEIDETKKYDLIMTYKVLEHQLDPHLELKKYTKILKPGGKLYISVPTWFDTMSNFGIQGFDLEYYYDPNHINVWTRPMFESMLARAGFKILEKDTVIYSSTYLCEYDPTVKETPIVRHSPAQVTGWLTKVKQAFMLTTENRFAEAISLWPDYPTAWAQYLEVNRKELASGWKPFKEKFIDPMLAACASNGVDALLTATDYAMRAHEWDQALSYAQAALEGKPENPMSLNHICTIMQQRAIRASDSKQRLDYFAQALTIAQHLRATSSQHWKEATDLIFALQAQLPIDDEAAVKPERPSNVLDFNHTRKGGENAQPELSL